VNLLNTEITRAFELPDVREQLSKLGVEFTGSTPDDVAEFMKSESAKWGRLIKAAGIREE
jgi:tripartite-type tricarboxylate transporter receptor subunit TctC